MDIFLQTSVSLTPRFLVSVFDYLIKMTGFMIIQNPKWICWAIHFSGNPELLRDYQNNVTSRKSILGSKS
jgi:hypothetical protein